MTERAMNPKDGLGSKSIPFSIVPGSFLATTAIGLTNGKYKYGRNNYRVSRVIASIYVDALKRHITDWFEGNWEDPVDGVPNFCGAAASLAILIDAYYTGTLIDDRNFAGHGYQVAMKDLTPHVVRLQELHKDRNPKQWTILDQNGEVLKTGEKVHERA